MLKASWESFFNTLERKKGFAKINELLVRLLSIVCFPFLYILLTIINIFKEVRIGFLFNRRFGHLALNTDLHLRRLQLGATPNNVFYIFFAYEPANQQLVRMFQREMNIINNEFLSKLFSPICFFRTKFCYELPFNANEFKEFNDASSSLNFTKGEEEFAKSELKKMNINENDWYVCIFARDNKYGETAFPTMNQSSEEHRNADIDDYIKAVKFIVDKGGYVIRMGSDVVKEFSYKHPRVIDYAVNYRSDFMDIYLPAHCYFYLGTSSGGVEIVKVFDRPQAAVNWMPIGSATFGKNEIFIPKKVIYKDSELEVPFIKQLAILGDLVVKFGDTPEDILLKNNMVLKNNSKDEILALVVEMYERLNNDFQQTDKYREKFDRYHEILSAKNHWCSNVYTPIGQQFLLSMKLDEND